MGGPEADAADSAGRDCATGNVRAANVGRLGRLVMIGVSVEPSHLVAGRRVQLAIRFANKGRRACSDVVFKLGLPSAITIVGGTNRIEIPVITPGQVRTHEITVEPKRPGEFQLTSTNFSYRDEFDEPVRVTDFRARLSVAEPPPPRLQSPPPVPVVRPVGRLGVEHIGDDLTLGEWDVLQVLVRNKTGIPLSDVTVAVSGPFRTEGKRARIAALADGRTAKFPFNVNAAEGGRHVPVSVHTTYRYPDGLGEQEDRLEVVVAKPGAPNTPPVTATTARSTHQQRQMEDLHEAGKAREESAVAGLRVFVSYSHRDERHRQRLEASLAQLRRSDLISIWHDRKILPGDEWDREIDKSLARANLILLLVSPDFLASEYAYGREMEQALERHRSRSAIVVPIILRPSDWQNSPLGSLQALPREGRPVSKWPNRDEAWLDVVRGLRRLISR